MKLKVLSYNIHKGFSFANTRFMLKHIKGLVRALGVDIAFLQEVVGENQRHKKATTDWPTESQFEYLADEVWAYHAYGKNAVYEEGHHGNAILSQFPIVEWANNDISTNRFESRGFLYSKIGVHEIGEVHLICLHFDLLERGRLVQLEELCRFINARIPPDQPLIVAGDFNDWTGIISEAFISETGVVEAHKYCHGNYAKTFPAFFPMVRLDRIFIRNLTALNCHVLPVTEKGLSDHLPLLAELEFHSR